MNLKFQVTDAESCTLEAISMDYTPKALRKKAPKASFGIWSSDYI